MFPWFEKHNKISWTITILIAITIFTLSCFSFEGPVAEGFGWKATAYHFFAFLFLALFLLFAMIQGKTKKFNLIILGIIISIAYGISDEIHQIFVPGRVFSLLDILTNSAGILFISVLYSLHLWSKNRKPRNKKKN